MISNQIISVLLISSFFSCTNLQVKKEKRRLDFGSFSIETPNSWKPIRERIPYDSYVGSIAVDETDTIYFDLGCCSYDLTEYVKMNMGDSNLFFLKENRNNRLIRGDSIMIDSLVKSKCRRDNIDYRKAKLVYPKISGTGITGVYIDSVWKAGVSRAKFNLYGNNLKPKTEKAFFESIKTLRFKEK